jgi:hypothetical protein
MVSLVETIPGIDLDIHLWESGEWGHSGIDEYGRREMIWEPTQRKYKVDRVWFYNSDGSDRPHDFDSVKFEAMLNWRKGV